MCFFCLFYLPARVYHSGPNGINENWVAGICAAAHIPIPILPSIDCMHKHLSGLLVALLFTLSAFAQDFDSTMWVADNPVITVTRGGNTIYLGGQFSSIGPPTGNGATLNVQNGTLPAVLPAKIVGTVRTSIPDGKGGWYVGGEITRVGNQHRTGLAHILADGKVDPDWNVKLGGGQGIVYTLALANNILYVGGDFATAGGQPRNALLAVDAPTGRVTGWNP
jgi:hypothetical protein